MFKRILCILCVFLLLTSCAAAEEKPAFAYDFDLTFSLNPDAFPPVSRSRAQGYAAMLGRLRLQGNLIWSVSHNSYEINGSLSFRDKPEVSVPFRIYGLPSMIYLTSPAINNEIILLNMSAFLEFAAKARENLGVPLPYFAFFYPPTTEYSFTGMVRIWEEEIGEIKESCEIPASKLDKVASLWEEEMEENSYLALWISTLAGGSDAPEAVTSEFANLPFYPREYVTGGKPLTVSVGEGTETWKNAAGQTLFSKEQTERSLSWTLSLPETEYRYLPYLSFTRQSDGAGSISLSLKASYTRKEKELIPSASTEASAEEATAADAPSPETAPAPEGGDVILEEAPADAGSEGQDEDAYHDESYYWPDRLLEITVDAAGLPESLPMDSAFSLSVQERGVLFPNVAFLLEGETKKDGSLSLLLKKPSSGEGGAVDVFRVEGTLVPVEPSMIPEYRGKVFQGAYNLFSLNEEKVGRLKKDIMPGLVNTMLGFVAEAPTSFVQSFLDDITDIGLLGVFISQ